MLSKNTILTGMIGQNVDIRPIGPTLHVWGNAKGAFTIVKVGEDVFEAIDTKKATHYFSISFIFEIKP